MTTKTFTTKTDAINHLIIPALGEYATSYDLDGLADAILYFDRDRQAFVQSVTTDEFWETARQHELQLDVEWVPGVNEVTAVWKIATPHSIEQGTALANGAIRATEDEAESLARIDTALVLVGYERGERIAQSGYFDWFEVTTTN